MTTDRFEFERGLRSTGAQRIAGVDEAGRGPLAGPVVAAAVILPLRWIHAGIPETLAGLNDSKQLSLKQRERFFSALVQHPEIQHGVGVVEPAQIDELNILQATHQAMVAALRALTPPPDHVLVDGLRVGAITWPQTPIVQGDARSYSIAAASVIAKVTRDRTMLELDARFPGYGFARHKGYGTPAHLEALQRLGPCPAHRRSFAPLKPAQPELFG